MNKEPPKKRTKKSSGRPALSYRDIITKEVKENIPKWKRQGQSDEWIAKKIGIGYSKLREWKKQYKTFSTLFKKGKLDLLLDLEETLYTRAKGQYVVDEEITINPDGSETRRSKKKFIWSDSNLQFALKNLDPEKWGDKSEGESQEDKLDKLIGKLDDKL